MSKNATVRISEDSQNVLRNNFKNLNEAITLLVEPFDKLRKMTITERKGYFTREEVVAMVSSLNGTLITPDFIYNKQFFIHQLSDFESFENGVSRHEAALEPLVEKIKQLSSAEVYVITLDIYTFWNTGGDLEDYLSKWI